MITDWRGPQIVAAVEEAFRGTALLLERQATEVISDPGAFPSYPGDMVDTGAFRASQRLEFTSSTTAELSYSMEYSLPLLLGYTTRSGKVFPPRNAPEEALRRLDFAGTFTRLYREAR